MSTTDTFRPGLCDWIPDCFEPRRCARTLCGMACRTNRGGSGPPRTVADDYRASRSKTAITSALSPVGDDLSWATVAEVQTRFAGVLGR